SSDCACRSTVRNSLTSTCAPEALPPSKGFRSVGCPRSCAIPWLAPAAAINQAAQTEPVRRATALESIRFCLNIDLLLRRRPLGGASLAGVSGPRDAQFDHHSVFLQDHATLVNLKEREPGDLLADLHHLTRLGPAGRLDHRDRARANHGRSQPQSGRL